MGVLPSCVAQPGNRPGRENRAWQDGRSVTNRQYVGQVRRPLMWCHGASGVLLTDAVPKLIGLNDRHEALSSKPIWEQQALIILVKLV